MKFSTDDATFYEDGNQIEYWTGEHPIEDRVFRTSTFAQTKTFCKENGMELYVQLENGDTIESDDYTPSNVIYELQIGYHTNKARNYQRAITTDFTVENTLFETHEDKKIIYTHIMPQHHNDNVYEVCANHLDVICEVARLNNETDIFHTIDPVSFEIKQGDDVEIWSDIKVWVREPCEIEGETLLYQKETVHAYWYKEGVYEENYYTEKFYDPIDGHILHFEIKSFNTRDHYTVTIMGYDRHEWEVTDGIHGDYHGYYYFDSWEEVEEFFREEYGKTLVMLKETTKRY